jgi:predicted nucleotidyltransferase
MPLPAAEARAVAELVEHVRTRFGARLRELGLFGSFARGEANEDSDVDVLVVVDDLTFLEGQEVAHFCGDLLTEHDVLVSPFAVSTDHMQHLRSRERQIAREIDRDRVPL